MKKILIIFALIMIISSSLALADNRFNQISKENFNLKPILPVENFKETDDVNCGDVLTSNTVLTSDLTCTGDGLIIGANGVVLDCAGHSITYSTTIDGIGIFSNNKNNLNIKNCNLIKGDWSGGSYSLAIYLDNIDDSVIEYNTIIMNDDKENYAIQLDGENSVIQHNIINVVGDEPCGIGIVSPSQNVIVLSNEIQSQGTNSKGIGLWANSLNTHISNNDIYNADVGIYLYGEVDAPDNTYISNNDLTNIQTWDLLIDQDADEIILENQSIEEYKIIDSNIIVKKTGIGEVYFDEDFTVSGNNLDEDIKIENNNISIDIVNKPGLNVSGSIVFYNPQTFAFGPQYIPLKNGIKCNNPFHLNVCTDFEYESSSETFSFDVSEMAESFKIDGTLLPTPMLTANPDFGPVGSNVNVNISWFFANVGDEFTIMFDDYEVGSFIYPELNYPLENSFIVSIVVPSMPTGEYDVNLKEESIGKDIFTVTASSYKKEIVEEVNVVKNVVEKENVQKTERKIVEGIVKSEPVKKTTLSSNNKAFYSFYI